MEEVIHIIIIPDVREVALVGTPFGEDILLGVAAS
eukprot:CAMPEP_0115888864 /NCGR_PEP_ID=MMETSP0287-20121206/32527_1 /TAXON_ID=412157 /ORGANISM="Chrysochromulina rotalis, Strain UIO044" /LENGTH=34 /DNA_ID= /DNA_START= /DNA_END= /DNA_ORIENTATION=